MLLKIHPKPTDKRDKKLADSCKTQLNLISSPAFKISRGRVQYLL